MMTEDPYPGSNGKYLRMPPATIVPRVEEAHRKWRAEQTADIPVPISSTV
jgi:hypothetical protein